MQRSLSTGLLALLFTAPAAAQVSKCDFGHSITTGCHADGTGYAIITGLDPDGSFEIRWNGDEATGGTQLTGLQNGNYWVSVFDGYACEVIINFTIDCPPPGGGTGPKPDDSPCLFRTQTQGGWGSPGRGRNPGAYRDAHFAQAFPQGLEIGCGSRRLRLTSASAVQAFLPSGSNARMLNPGTLVDPGNSYRNVLAGQLVALTLSVGFDAANPAFGASNLPLGQAYLGSGTFQGWTVQQLLTEANRFIGGCGSAYSAAQLNNALAMVNESFVDGTANSGALSCHPPGAPKTTDAALATMLLHPNPANAELWVHLTTSADAQGQLLLRDAMGRVVVERRAIHLPAGVQHTMLDVSGLANGTYFVELEYNGQRTVQRVLVAH